MRANDTPRSTRPAPEGHAAAAEDRAVVPEVDVVVPLFRPGAWLERCVASVRASRGVRASLVLVDDTPHDPAVAAFVALESFAAASDDLSLVAMPRNAGFAAAANAGIAAGTAPYVLLLNQDAAVTPDYAARLVARMEADPRLASVAGKILHADDDGATDGTIDSVGLEMRRGRRAVDVGQGSPDDGRWDGCRDVFGISAAAALYRRAALEAVAVDGAVFDEAFVMYKEDVDLAWRLRAAGWTAAVDGTAVAVHARGAERAPDSTGAGAVGGTAGGIATRPLAAVSPVLAQERAKSRRVRQLAWRNQLLLLIKNEEADDLARSLAEILALQAAYAATGLLVDPWGTTESRVRFLTDVVPAFRAREAWRRSRTTRVSVWLP